MRHTRIARLHTHRGTEEVGRRHARFHRKIVFAVHQEVGQAQTRVQPPGFRGAPFGITVQRRLVSLHHLPAIRFVQDCRLTTVRDAVFGRKTVVGVVQAEAQRQGQLRCPHPLRARIPIVDTVVNFFIQIAVAVPLQSGTTRFVVEGEMTLRTVARIGQSEVVHPMLAQRQLPFERGEAVAPTHAHFIFVAHLVFRSIGRLVPTVRSRRDIILSGIAHKRERAPTIGAVVQVEIHVGERIVRIILLAVAFGVGIGNGQCRRRKQIEPRAPHSDVEGGAPFHDRAAHAQIGRSQTDAEIHMIAFGIAGLRGHVYHTRQAAAVTRGKRRLVERHIANGRHVEGRKQTAEVVHLIDRVAVDEKQVLVVVATPHHHARQPLESGRNSGLHLQGLDQIYLTHDGRNASNLFGSQEIEPHGGIVHFVLPTAYDQRTVQFDRARRTVGGGAHRIRSHDEGRFAAAGSRGGNGRGAAQKEQQGGERKRMHGRNKSFRACTTTNVDAGTRRSLASGSQPGG